MLLKEMNFRDIVDKYLYIDAAGVAQNLGSIFEVTEDATGVLCYCYIDAQAGITFEILCCAVHDAAKKTLKLLHGNGEQSAKIRLAELLEVQAAVLPSEMPRLSEFQSKVAMVQKACAGYYDVVLMDIQMPKMNGYQATKAIRKLPDERAQVPIIAMTANAFEEDRQAAFAAGMDDYLAKPIEIDKLLRKIVKALKKK